MMSTWAVSKGKDQIGSHHPRTRAVFILSYAAEPEVLLEKLPRDEATAKANAWLLNMPDQLELAYCGHAVEALPKLG